jgi:glucuronate isomerase
MKPFIHDDFLLGCESARRLYHDYVADLPIIDYHCHLAPEEVATDHRFRSMTELWLSGDHYKWRAMRANGVAEELCTGAAPDEQKFLAWARTVPFTLRNPLFHWTHMELAFPLGIRDRLLDESTAHEIYGRCNERLAQPEFSAGGLMQQYRVEVVCTTDDPSDSLEWHSAHSAKPKAATRMYPTWRPDRALWVEDAASYRTWLSELERASNRNIVTYDDLLAALERRHTAFHAAGCRLSDHGLEIMVGDPAPQHDVERVFTKVRAGKAVDPVAADGFRAALLHELATWDAERGWVQQFHIGAMRDNNSKRRAQIGPNTGFDSIGEGDHVKRLARFLDRLDARDALAKTILYNINPRDNEAFATLIGSFQDGVTAGKMQLGSAWWFLDQLDGMKRQLDALSNMGLLSHFVGMLTDSRSFLSYSRHDYFRRLLCQLLGSEMECGSLPSDFGLIGELARRVAYSNARDFFPWPTGPVGEHKAEP